MMVHTESGAALPIPKTKPLRDRKYLDSFKDRTCVLTGSPNVVPHHILWRSGKSLSEQPGDDRAIPLRKDLHDHLHSIGEAPFFRWAFGGSDRVPFSRADEFMMQCVLAYARQLYEEWVNGN